MNRHKLSTLHLWIVTVGEEHLPGVKGWVQGPAGGWEIFPRNHLGLRCFHFVIRKEGPSSHTWEFFKSHHVVSPGPGWKTGILISASQVPSSSHKTPPQESLMPKEPQKFYICWLSNLKSMTMKSQIPYSLLGSLYSYYLGLITNKVVIVNTALPVNIGFLHYSCDIIGMTILHLINSGSIRKCFFVLTGVTCAYIPAFGLHSSACDPSQYSWYIS